MMMPSIRFELHRGHCACAGADADLYHVAEREPGLLQDDTQDVLGGRPRGRHPDPETLQIGRRAIGFRQIRPQAERDARLIDVEHDRDKVHPLRLQDDGVFERPEHHVDAAADEGIDGLRSGLEVLELDAEAFVAKIAEPIRQGRRKLADQRLSAHGDRERLERCRIRLRRGGPERQRRHGENCQRGQKSIRHLASPPRLNSASTLNSFGAAA